MNRGFAYYFKKSKDLFSFVFRKQKASGRLSLILYSIASFFGKLLFFTRPIFLVSDQNLANMIVNGHSYAILKAFHGTRERYFKVLFANLVEVAIYFAIAVAIVAPFTLLLIGQGHIVIYRIAMILIYVASGAWSIVALVVSLNYAFVPYVASKNKEIDFSDYLYNSRVSTRGLKGMIFGEYVVTFLIADLPLMIVFALPWAFLWAPDGWSLIVDVLAIIGVVLLYVFVTVPFHVKKTLFIYMLGEDACKTSKSIVVKRRISSKVEYDPLFDVPVKNENVDINS